MPINKTRMHFLLVIIFSISVIGIGIAIAVKLFPDFSEQFRLSAAVAAIEKNSGKKFSEWQSDRSKACSADAAEAAKQPGGIVGSNPIERANTYYSICIEPPADMSVTTSDVLAGYVKANLANMAAYLGIGLFISWLLGWIFTKGIPGLWIRIRTWLTTGEKN